MAGGGATKIQSRSQLPVDRRAANSQILNKYWTNTEQLLVNTLQILTNTGKYWQIHTNTESSFKFSLNFCTCREDRRESEEVKGGWWPFPRDPPFPPIPRDPMAEEGKVPRRGELLSVVSFLSWTAQKSAGDCLHIWLSVCLSVRRLSVWWNSSKIIAKHPP